MCRRCIFDRGSLRIQIVFGQGAMTRKTRGGLWWVPGDDDVDDGSMCVVLPDQANREEDSCRLMWRWGEVIRRGFIRFSKSETHRREQRRRRHRDQRVLVVKTRSWSSSSDHKQRHFSFIEENSLYGNKLACLARLTRVYTLFACLVQPHGMPCICMCHIYTWCTGKVIIERVVYNKSFFSVPRWSCILIQTR